MPAFPAVILVIISAVLVTAQSDPTLVKTVEGYVQGFERDGVYMWKGVPFATPPVGTNRWAVSTAHPAWSGVKKAIEQKPICPQFETFGELFVGEEDCLYLDVYAPVNRTAGEALPVMVWIYGGGFSVGDNWEFGFYDGKNLTLKHDVVLVAMNYRLGPLGFLALSELQNEDPHASTGNYGTQDQVLAMQWVQANVAAFGGDPNQVTIFGESAGAMSVCWHLANPYSKGLFHAAIMESGTCDNTDFFQDLTRATTWGVNYAASIGCNVTDFPSPESYLECLRDLTVQDILNSPLFPPGNKPPPPQPFALPKLAPVFPWGTTVDGSMYGLTDTPLNLISAGNWAQVPLMIGSNHNEGTIFLPAWPKIIPGVELPVNLTTLEYSMLHFFNASAAQAILMEYPDYDYESVDSRICTIVRDVMFTCPSRRVARAIASQGIPVYLYHWAYKGDFVEDPVLGDYHSSELDFVFDNAWPPVVHTFSARDQAMADIMGEYWTNFAKTFNPNTPVLWATNVTWPLYTVGTGLNIALEFPPTIQQHLYWGQCDVLDTIQEYYPS